MPALSSNRRGRRRWVLLLHGLVLVVPPPARASGWGISLDATTDYVFRGLSRSAGLPSLQGDVHYYSTSGRFAGVSVASVRLDPAQGPTVEAKGYLGFVRPLAGDWSTGLGYAHYDYPGEHQRQQYAYDEFSATLGYADRLFLNVAVSPDTSVESQRTVRYSGTAIAYELVLHQPLVSECSANEGIGYDDLRHLLGLGYVYWNMGLGYTRGKMQLDVAYIGTNATAKSLFYGDEPINHWTATVRWNF